MDVARNHSELLSIIQTAEHGATVMVATSTLKALGERAATRMGQDDLQFEISSEELRRNEGHP